MVELTDEQCCNPKLTEEQKEWCRATNCTETKNGWIHVKVSGKPCKRGFQYGYQVAKEYQKARRVFEEMTLQTTGKTLKFFTEKANHLQNNPKKQKEKIPSYLLDEMQGIATGMNARLGGNSITVDEIVGWNAWTEMTGYWWPWFQKQPQKNGDSTSTTSSSNAKGHCSAFIATGPATASGEIVIGHESFTEFWNGQFFNVILDITTDESDCDNVSFDGYKPEKSHRMVMQTAPGWISSMTDFWVTSAQLVAVETSIVNFQDYDENGTPEYVRIRNACQFANSIDQWVKIINDGNNGGYANMWLVGDIKTNEIANYQQGLAYAQLDVLKYVNSEWEKQSSFYEGSKLKSKHPIMTVAKTTVEKAKHCYFYGDNTPQNPQIRNLECTDTGYNDIRQQTGARRTRWPQLLDHYKGKIDEVIGQKMLGDTYDVYLGYLQPSSRTICSHYDVDPQPYVSDPNGVWNVPFYPAGSVDGKVTTAKLAKEMGMWGIFGRADGAPFDAEEFLQIHPQWNWQKGYLNSRPHQPWTLFLGHELRIPGQETKWSYHAEAKMDSADTQCSLLNWINDHSEGGCYKIATSDMKGKVARAVIFWCTEKLDIPTIQPWNATWNMELKSSMSDYDELYEQTAQYLGTLSNDEQFYAVVTYTNAKHDKATMTIWTPVLG